MSEPLAIAPLTKVALSLVASSKAVDDGPAVEPVDFSFVFGIGIEGLTAFERELVGKYPGDSLLLQVGGPQIQDYFEHLLSPLLNAVKTDPPFDLNLSIQTVSKVSDRELVRALALKGGDGDCGCGCDGCG